jgi:exodeoxyribonuclease V alpha subunit
MSELFEPVGPRDWRLTREGGGLLATFNEGHLINASDVHVATRIGELGGETDDRVLLALALTVRAVRRGSVCLDLATAHESAPELPWPDAAEWQQAVVDSPLVEAGVVRWDLDRLYLDRYHRLETQVCADLLARTGADPELAEPADEERLGATAALLRGTQVSDEQLAAAMSAARRRTTILTGGPGTGKTTTVARMLVLLADQAAARDEVLSIALAAPTGKAATRLEEAVEAGLAEVADYSADAKAAAERVGHPRGVTLHRLLGWRPDNSTRFRHDRSNRLKYDVVVVDESSMVELTMMGRLLEALRPQARLVLVGDPEQLTSVGAGAVLSDLVDGYGSGPESPVEPLTENFRSRQDIQALAEALRAGDADLVLDVLRTESDQVEFVEVANEADVEAALRPDCEASALAVLEAAVDEDAAAAIRALDEHRLLCAHREGPAGVNRWNRAVERWLAERPGVDLHGQWYVGRPLLVTSNDYALDIYNGEAGVVVRQGQRPRAFISGSEGLKEFAPGRLDAVETMHALTIHKSQGSQARTVSVLLPAVDSRLLTRELFYTAVTRAQERVRVVGTEAAVRLAVATKARRATRLPQRLSGPSAP